MTAATVVDPRFTPWRRWAAMQLEAHIQAGPAGVLQPGDESHWRNWARMFISLPSLAGLGLPRPEFFRRWQDWALAVNHVIYLAGG